MGPRNAAKVLEFAADYAKGRRLYLTTTHFHPEHAFGAQAFAGEATYLANRAQADDLAARGAGYLDMFRAMGEPVARQLEGVKLTTPDVVYDGSCDLDLGDRVVHLRPTGQAHTKGDQVDVRDYLEELRDETWRRQEWGMDEPKIAKEVRTLMIERHPDWAGQEWIESGVGCLYSEHAA
jgi:hypothetical protein